MESADREVLEAALGWLQAGQRVALATVVRTFGSAPRPVGALLALSDDGRLAGSVSGGCIEADLAQQVAAAFPASCAVRRYGVSADEARRVGLPCGGTLELVLEPLADESSLAPALQALEQRRQVVRELDLDSGRVAYLPAEGQEGCSFDGRILRRSFGARWRMLVIGAGQIARYLADLGRALDYQVLVCDPREEYARSWRGTGVEFLGGMPDDAVRQLRPDPHTVVLAVAHDPRLDDLALMEALTSQAFYVGALGAQAHQAKRRSRLLELGLSPQQVGRLHGPVGLPLGSRTPPEIALAILAEVTALRHGVRLVPEGTAPAADRR